jgi:glycosyltransferase involved in cell wall biosynthesis
MIGLFIHDHKFPKNGDYYYYSYGFDEAFFNRYLSIFDSLGIIGRENKTNQNTDDINLVDEEINFTTIENLRDLRNLETREKIKNEIKKSDYIVIRLPSILGLYAAKWARKYRKPYLIEVVGCAWDAIANKGLKHIPSALLIMYLMKKAILNSDYVVYVTEEFLQKRYPTKGEWVACSNVTLEDVNIKDLEDRLNKIEKIDLNEKVTIGTCATIDVVYKGQEDVIKAISQLKRDGYQLEYQLVGGGSSEYLSNVAQRYGVSDQVKFIGSLKHRDVFKWLESIDIYVHPSKQEGLSRAIIEAMSKGCPIFGANAGGINEQIDKDFIFDKGNVDEISRIFKNFSKNNMKEQAKKNHEKSKRYVKEKLYLRREEFFKKFIEENQ